MIQSPQKTRSFLSSSEMPKACDLTRQFGALVIFQLSYHYITDQWGSVQNNISPIQNEVVESLQNRLLHYVGGRSQALGHSVDVKNESKA